MSILNSLSGLSTNSLLISNKNSAASSKKNGLFSKSAAAKTNASYKATISSNVDSLSTLIGQVDSELSVFTATSSLTKNINFSSAFKSAFSNSAFNQSSFSLTPQTASQKITSLAKNIVDTASSTNNLPSSQKIKLLLAVMNLIDKAFTSTKDIYNSMNLYSGYTAQSLQQTQSLTSQNLTSYLNSLTTSTSSGTATGTTTGATTGTAGTTTGTTPTQPPNTQTTTQSTPSSILSDPNAQKALETLKNSDYFYFGSGTMALQYPIDGIIDNIHFSNQLQTDINGIQHVISVSLETNTVMLDYGTQTFGNFFGNLTEASKYIDTAQQATILDSSGQTHTIQGVFANGTVTDTVVDGVTMNSQELVNWASSAGLAANTYTISSGQQITEYHATTQSPYGSSDAIIAATVDGQALNRQEYLIDHGYSDKGIAPNWYTVSGYVETPSGNYVYLDENMVAGQAAINGTSVTDQQLVNWAKQEGLETKSYDIAGNQVNEYYAGFVTSLGTKKIRIAAEVNGIVCNSLNWVNSSGSQLFFSENTATIEDASGNYITTGLWKTWYDVQTAQVEESLFSINGMVLTNEQDNIDWAKNNNLYNRTLTVNGKNVTEYYIYDTSQTDKNILNLFAVEVDGTAYSISDYVNSAYKAPDLTLTASPIVLDLTGNGIESVSAEQGVQFDLLGTGQKVQTGWVSPGAAFLALDKDNSGSIESGKELFGNQSGAANGYEELAKYDENNDGVINASDSIYNKLLLWQDTNMNGVSDTGELSSLADTGVSSINVNYNTVSETVTGGNQIRQRSFFTFENGTTGNTADIWFRYNAFSAYVNVA